jgi:hypothetical protein
MHKGGEGLHRRTRIITRKIRRRTTRTTAKIKKKKQQQS